MINGLVLPILAFWGLGVPELVLILVIVLVIFGPRKLPQIGKAIGQGVRALKRSSEGLDEEEETKKEKKKEREEEKEEEEGQEE